MIRAVFAKHLREIRRLLIKKSAEVFLALQSELQNILIDLLLNCCSIQERKHLVLL